MKIDKEKVNNRFTLIIKRGDTTYVLTNYTIEDNRHIK